MAKTVPEVPPRSSSEFDASLPAMAQRVVFTFADGRTLELHVPGATSIEGGRSAARTAGFVLRRGREILNVGVLEDLLHEKSRPGRRRRGALHGRFHRAHVRPGKNDSTATR
ncbi:MAG: hypothetical protein H0T76_21505 [Nannocystis sp.]|nr:hypothetical protein [Nannocystis sp.]MBA3549069.1 hypothetical protein [Nannocystis sp.]